MQRRHGLCRASKSPFGALSRRKKICGWLGADLEGAGWTPFAFSGSSDSWFQLPEVTLRQPPFGTANSKLCLVSLSNLWTFSFLKTGFKVSQYGIKHLEGLSSVDICPFGHSGNLDGFFVWGPFFVASPQFLQHMWIFVIDQGRGPRCTRALGHLSRDKWRNSYA